MTFFGDTIRKAREAKGLTTSQVAERTRILVQIIDAMEREDFKRIPAAIYGRGFVRHICECLDLDSKPLVAEFMDIYEGRKPPASADAFPARRAAEAPAPVSAPAPAPAVPEDTAAVAPASAPIVPEAAPAPEAADCAGAAALPLFEGVVPAAPQVPAEVPPANRAQDIFSAAYPQEDPAPAFQGPSAAEKFRASLSVVSHGVLGSVRQIPRSAWRIAVLVVGALAVLSLFAWGVSVLYRLTSAPVAPAAGKDEGAPAVRTAPAPKPAAKMPPLRSTGEKVPPLYAD